MKHYPKLTAQTAPKTIVLANGAFPTAPLPLQLIDAWIEGTEGYHLVCCDGAVNKLADYTNRLPDAVVGDLDSLSPEVKARLGQRLHHFPDQDTNDLTKTMHFVSEQLGLRAITLLGASGGREDHLLGNLSLLPTYVDLVDELVMPTDTGHFRLLSARSSLEVEIGQQISIFNFSLSPISLEGVHWPLQDYTLPQLWCGTLNRADEEVIRLQTTSPVLLYLADLIT
ncbi:MAG: thiamine diphosphokinase [Porphyromonadaceae bacterium]|nr:thiamine diphosphokinase [Porphyromonadaceae bacterium]